MAKVTVHASVSFDAMAKLHGIMAVNKKSISETMEEIIIKHGVIDYSKMATIDLIGLRMEIQDILDTRTEPKEVMNE